MRYTNSKTVDKIKNLVNSGTSTFVNVFIIKFLALFLKIIKKRKIKWNKN